MSIPFEGLVIEDHERGIFMVNRRVYLGEVYLT
jgi:hypothetical protein